MAKESSGRPEVAGQEADLINKKKQDAALKKAKKKGQVQEGDEQAAADQGQDSAFAKEGQVMVAQAGGTASDASGTPPPVDGGGMSAGAWTAAILTTVGVAGIAIAASDNGGGGGNNNGGGQVAPDALNATIAATEDTVLSANLPTAVDPNPNDVLTYSLVANSLTAGAGTVTVNPDGSFVYTPAANFSGTATFQYTVNDGQGGSDTATITLNVANVNDAPVGANGNANTNEDTVLNGTLPAATDADNNPLTYALATGASNGTVVVNANGTYTYTPNANFNGADSFTFTVNDGNGGVVTYTQNITVASVNDAPVAQAQTLPAIEDTPLNGAVTATDADGNTLTYGVGGGGATTQGGQVVMQPDGSFTYTPAAGFAGADSFTYTVSDGAGGTASAVITINVANVADVFTPGTDLFNGSGADEVFVGTNTNLNAGDSVNGGGGFDVVTHSVDSGLLNNFAGFIFQNVDVFQVTSDAPLSATTTYDLSSSGPIGVLRVVNSTDNIVFNNAAAGATAANTTFLEILDQTGTTTDISLDIRDIDAAGGSDVVDVTVRSATNVGNAIDDLNIDFAVETVRIHTDGPLAVVIDDLNTDLGGAAGSGAVNLVLDAQDSSLTINAPLTANVKNVDGTSSTQNLSFSVLNANGNTTINTGSGNDTIIGASGFTNNVNSGAGNDSVTGGGVADNITTGEGADSVAGLAGADNISTGNGNDTVDAGADNDTVLTGAGNDVIDDGLGNDTVDAGADNDTVNLNTGADRILLGDGLDVVNAGANLTVADTVTGGAGNDILNILTDNAANDLNNVTQVERIVLQDDNGAYNYFIGFNSAFANDSTIVTVDGSALDAGGVETLVFDASNLNNRGIIIIGGSSSDTLTGGNGTDTLLGGVGSDILTGNNGDDTFVVRGNGEQTVTDTVSGGNGTDTLLALKDNVGGANETFVLGGGVTSVEQLNVRNQAFDNSQFNPDHLSSVTRNAGVVTITFDAGYTNGGTTMTVDAQDTNNGLASNQQLVLDASANGVGENLIVRSGSGNDSLSFGLGSDQVFGNDGNDTINMNAGLNGDTVDGGNSTATNLDEGNSLNVEQVTGNQLMVNAGTVDASYTNVSNIQTLTITTAGVTVLGTEADAGGIGLVNLNPAGVGGGNDTLNASGYTDGLVVNDFGGNDSISTGSGADTVNFGTGSDSVALGNGANAVYVQNTELDFTDAIQGGTGVDEVRMDNSLGGAVNAGVNLTNVISVDRYEFTNNGDRDANNDGFDDTTGVFTNDIDNNSLTFTGGNVSSVNIITVDASGLTDQADSFTVTLDAGQTDADFRFDIIGSATDDTFVKQNTTIQNTVNYSGGAGDDALVMDGDAQGANVTFDGGAGRGAAADGLTQAEALENAINGVQEGDEIRSSGGSWIDNDFTNISNVEILTSLTGVALNATLGAEAAQSGIKVIVGSNQNDVVVFDPAFNDTDGVVIDISAGGNDTFNAAISAGVVQFVGDADDFDANDVLAGSSNVANADSVHIRNNGTADLSTVSNIELIKVERTVTGGDITINLGAAAGAPNGVGFQTVDGTELQQNLGLGFSEDLTVNGQDSVIALRVTSGQGDDTVRGSAQSDTITTGSGNDSINGGQGADVIDAGSGNDLILTGVTNASTGDGLADTVLAGTGADTVVLGTGGDRVDLGSDNDADVVYLNPAAYDGINVTPVLGVPEVTSFNANHDVIRISNVFFADGLNTLSSNNGPGQSMVQGASWKDAGYPELVVITSNAGAQATTALGVAQFLAFNDLAADLDPMNPPAGNGQKGIFALTNGTDTFLWLYQDDSDNTIAADDFTLIAVIRGASNLSGGNLQLTSGGFTAFDDAVLVLDGSTVDGLDGNDTITLVNQGAPGASVQVSNVETVLATADNDTIVFNDADVVPQTVEVVTNGGTDNITITAGQTLVLSSFANVSVNGDSGQDGLILRDTGAPHGIVMQGIDSVQGSNGNDTLAWTLAESGTVTVNGGAGDDVVNGANGGQNFELTGVETINAGTGSDVIVADGALVEANLDADNDFLIFTSAANASVTGGAGNDQVDGSDDADVLTLDGVENVVAKDGDDTVNLVSAGTVGIDGGLGTDLVNGSTGNDILTLTAVENLSADAGEDTVTVSDSLLISADLGAGSDTLTFTAQANAAIDGGSGDDTVVGSASDDTLEIVNVESVDGGVGSDSVTASAGNDVFTVVNVENIDGGAGSDTVNGTAAADTLTLGAVEQVNSDAGADQITADGALNSATLGAGNDSLTLTAAAAGATVDGGADADTVNGSTGNDFLVLSAVEEADTGSGNDSVSATGALGLAVLGAGNDLLSYTSDAANASVDGGDDLDTVIGSASADTFLLSNVERIISGGGADVVTADEDLAQADLGSGNDSLDLSGAAAGANLTVDGGAGSDVVTATGFDDTLDLSGVESVDAGAGNDTVTADDDLETAVLGAGNDVLTFNAQATATVDGGADSDTVNGSADDDTLQLTAVEEANGDAGNDTITATDSNLASATLGAGNDVLTFNTAANAVVDGGADADTVNGSASADTLTLTTVESVVAGAGNDVVTVDGTALTADLGDDNDDLTFSAAANGTVIGGAGTDSVNGSSGNDVISVSQVEDLETLGGNDTVSVTDTTAITIDLGAGSDSVQFTAAADASVIGGADADTVTSGGADDVLDLSGVESVNSGNGSDTITFTTAAAATVNAGGGSDSVTGSGSDDAFTFIGNSVESADGGAGSDTLIFDTGAQTISLQNFESINSGNGNDSITLLAANAAVVTIDAGAGAADAVSGSGGADLLVVTGVENLSTGGGADQVTLTDATATLIDLGGGADDLVLTVALNGTSISGGAGNDEVTGTSNADVFTYSNTGGTDTLDLGGGNDAVGITDGNNSVLAGAGNDTVVGGTGNDTIVGGLGQDQLGGGAGSDLFTFSVGDSSSFTGTDADVISDFVSGDDSIRFVGGPAGSGANYAEADTFVDFADALAAADAALGAGVVYFFGGTSDGNGYVFYDANLNGQMDITGDVVVALAGVTDATTFDFSDIVV